MAKQYYGFWGEGYMLLSAEEMPFLRASEAVTLLHSCFFANTGMQAFCKPKQNTDEQAHHLMSKAYKDYEYN